MGFRVGVVLLEVTGTLPRAPSRSKERQPPYRDEAIPKKVREKLDKVLAKGYIELIDIEFVESIMYMFHVADSDDI